MKKSELKVLLPIILLYVIFISYESVVYSPIWDEGSHNFVLFFVHDVITEHTELLADLNSLKEYAIDYNMNYSFYSSIYYHPPLYKIFALLFFFLLGPGIIALRIPTIILGVIGIFLAYIIAKEISKSKSISITTTLLFTFSHVYLQWSSFGNIDVALSTFVLVSFYLFIMYEKTKAPIYIYLSGLFIGLSFLLKMSGISSILIIIFYKILSGKTKVILSRQYIFTYAIIFFVCLPWIAFYLFRPYENLSTIENFILRGNILSIEYWPRVLFNLVYFVSVPGLFIFMIKRKLKESDFNKLILLWAGLYLFTFIFIYDYFNGFPRLVLPALFPIMYVISVVLVNLRKRYLYVFFIVFAVQTLVFSLAYTYNPPVERAVDYILTESEPDTGIIITNANQQLYLMLKDRNREHFTLWFAGSINNTIRDFEENKGYPDNITLPVNYIIVDTHIIRDKEFLSDERLILKKAFSWSHLFANLKFMNDATGNTDRIEIYMISNTNYTTL